MLKSEPMAPGFPDVCLLLPRGRVGFIEFKTAVGVITALQGTVHARLRGLGFQVAVVRSVDDFQTVLECWLCPPPFIDTSKTP
jgi:hypothetical protein